jgi:tight adherence protein B
MIGVALGFMAGACLAWAVLELLAAAFLALLARAPGALRGLRGLAEVVVVAGREGRDPGAVERRRLLIAGALVALVAGAVVAGPLAGIALAVVGPWAVARLLRARRDHYRRAVDAGAAELAVALADGLTAGHSVRGAIGEAAAGVGGQAGRELRRTAAELAAGTPTGEALVALRARTQSSRIGAVVAACLVQGDAGGDLARLLRELARSFGDQARLEGEVRAATAQARFTGVVVGLMPLGGALLAELASPGFLLELVGSWLTTWFVGLALALQVLAAVVIQRLGRVRW